MANLKTSYLGIELKNPVIVGASNLVNNIENVKKLEEAGAAAIVYKSLFEEQIQLENAQLDDKLNEYSIADLVNRILPIVYSVVGIALFGLFIYGGVTWLMSAGDPDKVRKAQDVMLNAVIGVAIVIFAYLMTKIVGGILGMPLL